VSCGSYQNYSNVEFAIWSGAWFIPPSKLRRGPSSRGTTLTNPSICDQPQQWQQIHPCCEHGNISRLGYDLPPEKTFKYCTSLAVATFYSIFTLVKRICSLLSISQCKMFHLWLNNSHPFPTVSSLAMTQGVKVKFRQHNFSKSNLQWRRFWLARETSSPLP